VFPSRHVDILFALSHCIPRCVPLFSSAALGLLYGLLTFLDGLDALCGSDFF
jgi:hypothetical protein